ncbi:MAG: glutamate--cysteine ligase [Gammaproteobacteria bacterium]|jgi:glutamate--cysteine ligase|nr:glutamate--cysteine ligase [Gammaproteobacteria bacterium]
MSQPPADQSNSSPITGKQQLIEAISRGCKTKADWRIGTEHEKFGFFVDDLRPIPYAGERGIAAILNALCDQFHWQAVLENDNVIALRKDGCSITLEPGGQLELSGVPLENLHQTCNEAHQHLAEVKSVAEPMGIRFIGLGFQPKWRREDIPWVPKERYVIMREHMSRVGSLGLDMMKRTCTIQVNLDFSSEADMVKKFRTSLALQPLVTALFANSPFVEGKPSGYLSYRSHIWTDTDPQRCGQLDFVFDQSMGFERYVDYMLDVPMYFVYRGGHHIDAAGQSFRDFLNGKLPAYPGHLPTLQDWEDHLTTAFPEVRLKQFLEMRGADGGPWGRICALPAFWVGLLYHQPSLDAAWDLVKHWQPADRADFLQDVSREGLRATVDGRPLLELAQEVFELVEQGLQARAISNADGQDESIYLQSVRDAIVRGESPARHKLRLYENEWGRNIDPIFDQFAY